MFRSVSCCTNTQNANKMLGVLRQAFCEAPMQHFQNDDFQKTNRPRQTLPRKNLSGAGMIFSRGATLLCVSTHLWNTGIFPANNACPASWNTCVCFPHALCGPFAKQRSVRLSPSRTLWKCPLRFISASTVCFFCLSYSGTERNVCQSFHLTLSGEWR